MPTIVISPFNVASFPEGGGHLWVYLQYVLGLRLLGCDVYWLEAFRTKGREEQEAAALAAFRLRMQQYGLDRKYILYFTHSDESSPESPSEYLDMTRAEAEAIFTRADLLLNFHYAISPGLLARFRRTALVDIDPGLLQFWMTRGQLNVPHHDIYFTTGETISETTSGLPNGGARWTYFRPPVCLEHWPYGFNPYTRAFTTVSNWDASDWVVDDDQRYENTKRVAFLEFADLPRLTSQPLELALFLKRERDLAEQREPQMYAAYIRGSRGEFSCAKRSCMVFQNAWISDRTLCYLASGKPVVVQNTGPSSFLPDGEGMFRFSTAAEAADAFAAINANYERHCRAAREIAEAHFDARRSLETILNVALSAHVSAVGGR
ncbi:MAG: hypothetical protein DMG00_19955 [Acidobacteria bacterium]|nr:MAG: hypothetical protein DMG00_19955 [Acidobacteriota bacterium]